MVSEKSSTPNATVKYLCSYGGKIAPRSGDGKLRYVGGHTRVLAVDRSLSFSELMVRVSEFCGQSVELRCQLPKGDLETLISIKSDEELACLIEEYDRLCPGLKIRAVLSPPKSLKTVSPPPSARSSEADKSPFNANYYRQASYSPAIGYPAGIHGGVEKGCYSYGSPRYPIGMAQQRVVFGCDSRRIWH
ncbi:hypothetical protein LINGRAHAP2_LOCUS16923 [Linum grandiflorum]